MAELTFRYSFTKVAKVLIGGVVLEAVCVWIVWGHPTNPAPNFIVLSAAYVGVPFFAIGLAICLLHLFRANKIAVTIAHDGLIDSRISRDIIPWSAIKDASLYTTESKTIGVHVRLDPAFASKMHYIRLPGLRRLSDKLLTSAGLIVNTVELNTEAQVVLDAIQAYLKSANPSP